MSKLYTYSIALTKSVSYQVIGCYRYGSAHFSVWLPHVAYPTTSNTNKFYFNVFTNRSCDELWIWSANFIRDKWQWNMNDIWHWNMNDNDN